MTSSPALRWQLFRLLGEPARLRLLACAEREELSLGELADALGESLPNVSRHTTQLRQAGLLDERRLGTRTFVRFASAQSQDPLIDDALRVGRALCDEDAVFARIPEIIRRRDARTRELLQREGELRPARGVSDELPLYLSALRDIVPARDVAIDVAPGAGEQLDALSPIFRRVVALEPKEAARPSLAELRAAERGYDNVSFVSIEAREPWQRSDLSAVADLVLYVRRGEASGVSIARLGRLLKSGGRLAVIDCEPRAHGDSLSGELEGFERTRLETFDVARVLGGGERPPWKVLSGVRARA